MDSVNVLVQILWSLKETMGQVTVIVVIVTLHFYKALSLPGVSTHSNLICARPDMFSYENCHTLIS
jgi:hypothetical protein